MNARAFRRLTVVALTGAALAVAAGGASAASTITFDEFENQPIHGLSYGGVTFDFKVDGEDSREAGVSDSSFAADLAFLTAPVVEGRAAGVLTLDFDVPAAFLEFGIAVSNEADLVSACTLELFDSTLRRLDIVKLNTNLLLSFSETGFRYQGEPLKRVVIDFDERSASRFALDNLSFGAAEPAQFVRGDVDGDGSVNISDVVRILDASLSARGAQLECGDAADTDDTGTVNVQDAIHVLHYLFQGGPPPVPPFPQDGTDATPDDLGCESEQARSFSSPKRAGYGMFCFYSKSCPCWICLDR